MTPPHRFLRQIESAMWLVTTQSFIFIEIFTRLLSCHYGFRSS